MRMAHRRIVTVAPLCVLLSAALLAQRGPAKADLTPLTETDRVVAGRELKAALKVRLPEGYHVNSNKPRDPSLTPIRRKALKSSSSYSPSRPS